MCIRDRGIGDRTRPAEHRDGKGRNGNVVHICLHLLLSLIYIWAFIVVTGCYAQLKPEEVSHIEGVDLIFRPRSDYGASLFSLFQIVQIH